MPSFSKASLTRLATCHTDIQKVLFKAIKEVDFCVVCGYRGKIEQNKAFENHTSQKQFPKSNHNSVPSNAVDVVPYPEMWDATPERFQAMHEIIQRIADEMGIKLWWGGDWKKKTTDKIGWDAPHYSRVKEP